jgi:RNA polymerase sigma-70 factor (ECF subfamily)
MTPTLAQRTGVDRGFERLYRRHVHEVYRYALAILPTPEDAEDVTQTTFLNAYHAFSRGERPQSEYNWLIGIANELCRQRARQAARFEADDYDDQADEAAPEDEGPSAGDIRRALGHLAFDQRAALIMREIEGRSYEEIAEVLTVSLHTVESLIFRARRALREELEGTLTCHQAERAISRRLDGELARAERAPLRVHLRKCEECNAFIRSQLAQRAAIRALARAPLPSSLTSFFAPPETGASTA